MPTTISAIEAALAAVWSGKVLNVLSDPAGGFTPKPVAVFVDDPDVEEYPERVFPSIAIQFDGMSDDPASLDSEDEREVAYNSGVTPNTRTMRRAPIFYRVSFSVHSFTLDAQSDRELMLWVDSRLRTKDAIEVAPQQAYWIFREGNVEVADEQDKDRKIYHKVWTYTVLADIENTDTDQTGPVVHEVQVGLSLVKTLTKQGVQAPVDAQNTKTTAENAQKFIDFTFAFDEATFWLP